MFDPILASRSIDGISQHPPSTASTIQTLLSMAFLIKQTNIENKTGFCTLLSSTLEEIARDVYKMES